MGVLSVGRPNGDGDNGRSEDGARMGRAELRGEGFVGAYGFRADPPRGGVSAGPEGSP